MVRVKPFETFTERYDFWFERNKAAYLSELEALRKFVTGHNMALEVGVGTARFAAPLGIRFALDPAARMVEIARSRGIESVRGIAEKLPFKNCVFDLVLMVTTICFVDDIDASFREVRRVLKPNGKFVIGFIDRDSLVGKRISAMTDNPFYSEATLYSVKEVVEHLEKTGFEVKGFVQTIFDYPEKISQVEPVKEGFGEGSFVVVHAF